MFEVVRFAKNSPNEWAPSLAAIRQLPLEEIPRYLKIDTSSPRVIAKMAEITGALDRIA